MKKPQEMIIYNIFPTLAGRFAGWGEHFKRASEMDFNWVFLNPIQKPGYSGSLYSISDYFSFNPLLTDGSSKESQADQVKDMIAEARKYGLSVMIDLVVNHCAFDSDIIKKHPEWFSWDNGEVVHPFCYGDDGKKVIWGDLAKYDYQGTRDPEGLYQFIKKIVDFLIALGVKGFRCDAAYQLPGKFWKRLIRETKKANPGVLFFAETLGCTADQTRTTARAGFDYVFNSSKWWDLKGHWLMAQYNLTRDVSDSISFPDSHDTTRLMEDLKGNISGVKQRYLLSALYSAGVMMLMGYEFGFRRSTHVVHSRPEDWEKTNVNLTGFIKSVNDIKKRYSVFQEDAPTDILQCGNPNVLVLWKASSRTEDEALIIINKDIYNKQHFHAESLYEFVLAGAPLLDVSPEYPLNFIPEPFHYDLNPGQGLVYVTKRDGSRKT
ncbi:MAG: alpha-amylase family glycosyl hydrolase [Nitrospirota bacterium]